MVLRSRPAEGDRGMTAHVILLDDDPLSRQMLLHTLSHRHDLRVEVPTGAALPEPGAGRLVLLAHTPERPMRVDQIQALVARGHRVLVIGARWSADVIQRSLEAGASGCILRSPDVNGLAAAIHAAVAGHVIVSPELIPTYLHASEGPPAAAVEPTDRALELLDALTARELQILGLLGDGLATSEIAGQLYVSTATVKSHVSHALAKLGVRNRVQAVLLIKELGLLELSRTSPRGTGVPTHDGGDRP